MAETQLWMAAFFAFLAWFATAVMARLRSIELTSPAAHIVCWVIPALGLLAGVGLLYEGFFGAAGGYRSFAMGFVSLLFYVLIPILLLGQIIACALARRLDADSQ
ncbi:MAG: hypothetical protein AAF249_11660 [Pseudomonadota bacterium]